MAVIINDAATSEWGKKFFANLKAFPVRERALQNLQAEGFSIRVLLHFLRSYSNQAHATRVQAEKRERLRRMARSAARLSKRLSSASETLAELERSQLEYPISPSDLHVFDGLRELVSKRLKDSEALRKKYRRLASEISKGQGRDEESLVYLMLVIRRTTGEAHSVDLAHLLNAAFEAHGRRIDATHDLLKQICRRFRQKNPLTYQRMVELADQLPQLRKAPPKPRLKKQRLFILQEHKDNLTSRYTPPSEWKLY